MVHPISAVTTPVVAFVGSAERAELTNSKVSKLASEVLSSPSWVPGSKAGPIAYATCMALCISMAEVGVGIASGGVGVPFSLGPVYLACMAQCAPFLAAPTP